MADYKQKGLKKLRTATPVGKHVDAANILQGRPGAHAPGYTNILLARLPRLVPSAVKAGSVTSTPSTLPVSVWRRRSPSAAEHLLPATGAPAGGAPPWPSAHPGSHVRDFGEATAVRSFASGRGKFISPNTSPEHGPWCTLIFESQGPIVEICQGGDALPLPATISNVEFRAVRAVVPPAVRSRPVGTLTLSAARRTPAEELSLHPLWPMSGREGWQCSKAPPAAVRYPRECVRHEKPRQVQ